MNSIPEKRLASPGRMPSDIDGDVPIRTCLHCGRCQYEDEMRRVNPYHDYKDGYDFVCQQCAVDVAPEEELGMTLNDYAAEAHEANLKWWHDPKTGERIERNRGEQMMLIVSEIAEAMEGARKDLMDDKLPHRKMEEVEMADAVIRILDYCGGHGLDLEGAYREKMAFNAQRADHKAEHRLADGGKKF